MTSALPADLQSSAIANTLSPTTPRTISQASGVVPAQHPAKSYAIAATKTAATTSTSAGASQHAMNGAMSQGGSQPNNTTNGMNGDHSRKPSVVINASGASGQLLNGGPVQNNSSRPAISFGSMNASGAESQANAPFQQQHASLQAARQDPRVTSPAHSPSPIPQPAASGGRPPSISGGPGNGSLAFGSLPPETEMMRGQLPQGNVGAMQPHERRPSGHSMQSENSSQGVNMSRPGFQPSGAGRGRGYPQPPYMGSPAQNYRPMPGQQPRPGVPAPFHQQQAPGSPFNRQARASPVPMHTQPHMPPGNPAMYGQGYPQHLYPQPGQMPYGMPQFDPSSGYYPPYYYNQQSQSPRPQYPSPFQGAPGGGMQPPFHPPSTPSMVRTSSQVSERPPSSLGHPQTPAQNAPPAPSHTPNPSQSAVSGAFVKPRKSNAIKITDAQGNAINFNKPSTPSAHTQPQTPVIVSTPNAPTPPPRAPSTQHNRAESKSNRSAEETKNSFAEQVKRQAEESKRKEQEEAKAKLEREQAESKEDKKTEGVAEIEVKKAAADAEQAAAKAADDKTGVQEAAAAKESAEDEAARKKKQEDDDFERMIAEMEAKEREDEEREKAYKAKKDAEKAANAAKEAERAKKADEELKRQEREAEEREEARERERNGEKPADEADNEARSLFARLKKPTLGPGASSTAGGAETPESDGGGAEPGSEPETSAVPSGSAGGRAAGGQKPKPAHLKLETNKPVERAEPTPGMQALKSARFLSIQEEAKYPDGFKSPNPALNQTGSRKGRAYDKDFLLQFQNVFKEKPSVDWDQKVKDTLGPSDEPGSARGSARTPSGAMSSRQNSGRAPAMGNTFQMGQFGGGPMGPRTLPPNTTSEQRFAASSMGGGAPGRPGMPGMVRAPSGLGMGAGAGMTRQNSAMGSMGVPMSPRQPSGRGGRGGSKRDDRVKSRREEADIAAKMPLTAGMNITPLEKSQSGWKATSIGQPVAAAGPDPSGNMAPDLVQRKVKAALNKMTPEKFDKISDQILEIAAQSKNETDGRTLRQVIQLTFEKACDEAHWAGMYAKFCHKMLTSMSPEIRDETIRDKNDNAVVGGALFRKYLLNRCQEEFERGWQANLPDKPEGDSQEAALLSDEYYIAAAAKRKGLGLIQFIGQLYKLRMLTLRIMHECVMRLLNFEGDPDEAAVENLTTLLKAVGATMMEDEKGPSLIASYFDRIDNVVLKNESLPSRPRFMIMDLMDLRKAGWKGKDDAKGPKTIQQIHEEAEAAKAKEEAERQKSQRGGGGRMPAGRGDARNFSGGMPPPQDFSQSTVRSDDLRKLQARGSAAGRPAGAALGPGGGLGPSMLGARGGSRRGAGTLGAGSSGTSRTNTPPVDGKKEEPATAQNAFSALAGLDASGDQPDDTQSQSEAASPPATRNRSKSPMADES